MISILKITKEIILQKKYNFHTTIYKITKGHKTEKKCRRSNISQSMSGHTLICTKFRKIISNGIKKCKRSDPC